MLNEGYFNSMFNKNSFIKYERTVFDIGHEGGRVGQCQVTPLSVSLCRASSVGWPQLLPEIDNCAIKWIMQDDDEF